MRLHTKELNSSTFHLEMLHNHIHPTLGATYFISQDWQNKINLITLKWTFVYNEFAATAFIFHPSLNFIFK